MDRNQAVAWLSHPRSDAKTPEGCRSHDVWHVSTWKWYVNDIKWHEFHNICFHMFSKLSYDSSYTFSYPFLECLATSFFFPSPPLVTKTERISTPVTWTLENNNNNNCWMTSLGFFGFLIFFFLVGFLSSWDEWVVGVQSAGPASLKTFCTCCSVAKRRPLAKRRAWGRHRRARHKFSSEIQWNILDKC